MFLSKTSDSDPSRNDMSRFDMFTANYPAGGSFNNLIHYAQLISWPQDTFSRWNYGSPEANQAHYGQPTPPSYDLTKINFPIAFLYG